MITICREHVSNALRRAFNNVGRVFVVGLMSAMACAQQAPSLSGKWIAHYADSQGRDKEALVEIADSGGTWKDVVRGGQAKHNSCVSLVFPLTVKINESGEIGMRVEASETVTGCGNHKLILKMVDQRTLEGNLNSGRAIKLVRQ